MLFRPSDGTLTNLSTCATGVTADATKLAGVHTSLLDYGFPSSIAITNTGSAATTVRALAEGRAVGPNSSVDKLLFAKAEKDVNDLIMKARVKAGWVKEEDLVKPEPEAAEEEAPSA